jgi:hypothetical protein
MNTHRARYFARRRAFLASLVVEEGLCRLCERRSSVENSVGPTVVVPVAAQMNLWGSSTVRVCGGCLRKWYNAEIRGQDVAYLSQ